VCVSVTLLGDSTGREHTQEVRFEIAFTPAEQAQLNRIEAMLNTLVAFTKVEQTQMAAIDDQITALTQEVAANTTVTQSAETLIAGLSTQLATALQQSQAAGATPAQLLAFSTLTASLKANDGSLAQAVAANTAAAPPPTAPLVPPAS
jgi:hypothetical protein